MSSKHIALRLLGLVAIAAIMVGCASPTAISTPVAPTVDQQPTFNAVKTQAVQTVVSDLTKNAPTAAPIIPTNTPNPTSTGTPVSTATPEMPTKTATATFIPWTLTPTIGALSCSVTSVSPKATDKLSPTTDFDANWVIKNNGTQTWQHKETDIHYVSGTKFQKNGDLLDMSSDVTIGNSYTVTIHMNSPADAGTYTSTWAVAMGKDILCNLNLTVVVVK